MDIMVNLQMSFLNRVLPHFHYFGLIAFSSKLGGISKIIVACKRAMVAVAILFSMPMVLVSFQFPITSCNLNETGSVILWNALMMTCMSMLGYTVIMHHKFK